MGHFYPPGHLLDPHAGQAPPLSPLATRMAAFLDAGGRAVVLIGPPGSGKTAAMEHLLSGLSGTVTRVRDVRGAALDLPAILQQMGEPLPGEGDEAGLFFRTLAAAAYDEYSAVLAIDDAHALTPEALLAVARVPGLGGSVTPGMTLVLAGEPRLLDRLDAPGLDVFGNPRLTLVAHVPSGPAPVRVPAPDCTLPDCTLPDCTMPDCAMPDCTTTAHDTPPPALAQAGWLHRHRRDLGLVAGALVAGAVLATIGLTWTVSPPAPPLAVREVPAPPQPEPQTQTAVAPAVAPPVSTPSAPAPLPDLVVAPFDPPKAAASIAPALPPELPPPSPAVAAEPSLPELATPHETAPVPTPPAAKRPQLSEAQLHREFEAFLDRAGPDTAKLTTAARATLWREFLQWRARKGTTAGP